ncbi:hypothetical protein BV349_05317 [Pseudomonas syringae pv. actinidiae]|uniref:hypothetical protein n=1 Tax=Pseudomonas syringae TaxID=317 RepID=UPI000A25EF72|nr:hypothetical protein [Pseudomonas syringae]OSN59746.1 hypothetical protein BV349_05317 [Pseudomonas syringae pv. actinidiae]OSN68994.1 hypothetical protein BV351_05331 [Pseudomonas syringae pv. actinidiae]RMR93634.1 hypothetical protein ALP75_202926 [Pseudomonas syringae pv. actinidiae]
MLGVFVFCVRWIVTQGMQFRTATHHTYAATQRHALPIVTANKQKRFFIAMALTTPIAT